MIRLCVGISSLTPAWQSLFDQLGIQAEEIDFSKSLSLNYSCLIINDQHNRDELKKAETFFTKDSGGILNLKPNHKLFHELRTEATLSVELPISFQNKVSQYFAGSGLIYTFDFNFEFELTLNNAKRKRFPFKTGAHPDEIVSSLDRGGLISTIRILVKEMHIHRRLPYVSKWHSPSKKPIFAFRVDTDFGDKSSIQSLYKLADSFQVPMTWFLHVQAHEEWLDYFHIFKNQEIALHGYEHGTSTSYEHLMNNIEKGKQLMIDAGFDPTGFCVPYSIWNDTLGDVLNTYNFNYSSEFTLGYDTLPFYPIHQEEQHSTLQIPIHPICTGSLNRKRVSVSEMESYFETVLIQKNNQFQNVIFYHHPLQPGLELWKNIFRKVNALNLNKLTFSEIADFWKSRINSIINVFYDDKLLTLTCDSSNSNLLLEVSVNSKEFYLIKASQVNQSLNMFEAFKTPKPQFVSNETIKELNGERVQLLKTSILDWKNRRRL